MTIANLKFYDIISVVWHSETVSAKNEKAKKYLL